MNVLTRLELDPAAGARNLLRGCMRCQKGDRILIAFEPENFQYFDDDVVRIVEAEAKAIGLQVTLIDVGFEPTRFSLPARLEELLPTHDAVLFLSRLGDQLRFSSLPDGPTFAVCFASTRYMLGSDFGCTNYDALCKVKVVVDDAMANASEIVVSCANGTKFAGSAPEAPEGPSDTTVRRFPMSVFSPVSAERFSGRVALGGFLTGTGSQYYEDYSIEFEGQVFALLTHGRLDGFDGSAADVAKANAHYDRVSKRFGIDRNFVHSWHAGIHPGCGFPWDMRDNFERWGGAAFGNPRVLHFHTCGAYAPGEISWNLFDPTIELDGVRVWEDGRICLEQLTKGREVLDAYPDLKPLFECPDRNIGLGDAV